MTWQGKSAREISFLQSSSDGWTWGAKGKWGWSIQHKSHHEDKIKGIISCLPFECYRVDCMTLLVWLCHYCLLEKDCRGTRRDPLESGKQLAGACTLRRKFLRSSPPLLESMSEHLVVSPMPSVDITVAGVIDMTSWSVKQGKKFLD